MRTIALAGGIAHHALVVPLTLAITLAVALWGFAFAFPALAQSPATFDAVFSLRQLAGERADCRAAIERAARWALSCRNANGGFGHFPGSTSDADVNYFQVGTLVMAGFLKPVEPLPGDAHLLSWGHVMPLPADSAGTKK